MAKLALEFCTGWSKVNETWQTVKLISKIYQTSTGRYIVLMKVLWFMSSDKLHRGLNVDRNSSTLKQPWCRNASPDPPPNIASAFVNILKEMRRRTPLLMRAATLAKKVIIVHLERARNLKFDKQPTLPEPCVHNSRAPQTRRALTLAECAGHAYILHASF